MTAAGSRRWCLRSRAACGSRASTPRSTIPTKPPFAANYFTGVPAPAGAVTALLPVYLAFLGVWKMPAMLTAFYTLLIAFLMVSRLPVFSGKTVRMRVPPEMVLPVFVCVIFFIALLIGYPWHILSAGSMLYLLSLPLGWKSYRDHKRAYDAANAPAAAATRACARAGLHCDRSPSPKTTTGPSGCTEHLTPSCARQRDMRVPEYRGPIPDSCFERIAPQ